MDWEAEIMREMSNRAFRECEKLRALEEQTTAEEVRNESDEFKRPTHANS